MYGTRIVTLLGITLCGLVARAQNGLPTLEEAQKLSRESGKPILAMAGQKT